MVLLQADDPSETQPLIPIVYSPRDYSSPSKSTRFKSDVRDSAESKSKHSAAATADNPPDGVEADTAFDHAADMMDQTTADKAAVMAADSAAADSTEPGNGDTAGDNELETPANVSGEDMLVQLIEYNGFAA